MIIAIYALALATTAFLLGGFIAYNFKHQGLVISLIIPAIISGWFYIMMVILSITKPIILTTLSWQIMFFTFLELIALIGLYHLNKRLIESSFFYLTLVLLSTMLIILNIKYATTFMAEIYLLVITLIFAVSCVFFIKFKDETTQGEYYKLGTKPNPFLASPSKDPRFIKSNETIKNIVNQDLAFIIRMSAILYFLGVIGLFLTKLTCDPTIRPILIILVDIFLSCAMYAANIFFNNVDKTLASKSE